jgi:hypothetical protein
MKTPGSIRSLAAAAAALSLVTSSVASAAPVFANATPIAASPLVTLSIVGSAASRAALCAASTAALAGAAATAAVQPAPGCVLPAVDAPPPVVVSDVPPPAMPYAAAPVAVGAPNIWPLLAGLAAFSAVFFLLDDVILGDDDDDGFTIPPRPPCTGSPC